MDKLKALLLDVDDTDENETEEKEEVEVFADSLDEALELAAESLETELMNLDYKIIKRGSKGFLGVGRTPFHVLVSILPEDTRYNDLEDLNVSLDSVVGGNLNDLGEVVKVAKQKANVDGAILCRIFKTGVNVRVTAARGKGKEVTLKDALKGLRKIGATKFDEGLLKDALEKKQNEFVKIGEYIPKPEADSVLHIEMSENEMKAFVTIVAPRIGGKHLQMTEVKSFLRRQGVVYGFKPEVVKEALDSGIYGKPILAAEGDKVQHGDDAIIDYKVSIEKEKINFKEEGGKIDYKDLNLIENVVVGQVLAEKSPPKKGKPGKTITARIIPANDGEDVEIKYGKGTILSDDGTKLSAEINGQVVIVSEKITVEPVLKISGDVSVDTGNIVFLGSVIITGTIKDNFSVTAAGNIEVYGSVQKANLQAEGDIIIKQGIMGKDDSKIESSSGSVFAKFIQQSDISVEKDIIVAEAIMHTKAKAGGKIVLHGRKAAIQGGIIMAGDEVRAKTIGSTAGVQTEVTVGTNPKVLEQLYSLRNLQDKSKEKMGKVNQNIKTLEQQKNQLRASWPDDKEEMLVKLRAAKEKLEIRIKEAQGEIENVEDYMQQLNQTGKVHVEKTLFPGVTIIIKEVSFPIRQEFKYVTLMEEQKEIKIEPYEQVKVDDWRKKRRRK